MDKTVVCSFKTGKADMILTWLVRRDYRVQKVEYVIYCIFTIYCIHVLCCKKMHLIPSRWYHSMFGCLTQHTLIVR